MMMKFGVSIIFLLFSFSYSFADVVSEARALIDEGKMSDASELLLDELEVNPDSPNIGTLNALLGEALFKQGEFTTATSYLEKAKNHGVADASLWLGRLALKNYNFTNASSLYDQYIRLRTNAKKEVDPGAVSERNAIPKARQALERVERIQIIDSLTVPREEFFKAYRIPASAGRFFAPSESPVNAVAGDARMIFVNEKGDDAYWALPDSTGYLHIVESIRLTDGTWNEPVFTPDILNGGADADYPFMMPDGLTLYFANNGEDSIGGYDIFIASRDATDGSWLAPQNLGMPYNSPFDDYLLAIDEQTGVGWWATERNLLPNDITLYVFIPNERRINIDTDEPRLLDFARIADIKMTQDPETDIETLLDTIASIDPGNGGQDEDFNFLFPDGTRVTLYSRLSSEAQKAAMYEYQEALSSFNDSMKRLDALRRDYHFSGSTAALKLKISELENLCLKQKKNLRKLKNNLIKTQ